MQENPTPAYRTYVFDCDGVVLDSNNLKTLSFREAALPYGEDVADALVEYHVRHRGVTRFEKFRTCSKNLCLVVPRGRITINCSSGMPMLSGISCSPAR